jgi:hypothetical protein
MEVIYQHDSSYFKISLPNSDNRDITNDVISLEITESIGEIITGNLSLNDPFHFYSSQLLPEGTEFKISWGYKNKWENLAQLEVSEKNPTELVNSGGVRQGLKAIIITPQGGGSNQGAITYNCKFYAYEYLQNLKETKVFSTGTKRTVIEEIFNSLGVKTSVIDFQRQNEQNTSTTSVRQNEGNIAFLIRLAYEWRCLFRTGYDQAGNLIAVFVDNSKIGDQTLSTFLMNITGGVGSSKLLEYGMGSIANTLNYTWQRHIGESGQGDGVNVNIINGQPVITTYIAATETVKTLKLNENRLEEYIKQNKENEIEITKEIFNAKSLTSRVGKTTVQWFFDEIDSKTAPQGLGYTITGEIIGDPAFTPIVEIIFGEGFPAQLQNINVTINKFYVKSCIHRLSQSGYITSFEIGDAITIFGGFIRG